MLAIRPAYYCSPGLEETAQKILQTAGYGDFSVYLLSNCEVSYEVDTIGPLWERLQCPWNATYYHVCRQSAPDNYTSNLCSLYKQPVTFPSTGDVFKNVHCAVCAASLGTAHELKCFNFSEGEHQDRYPGKGKDSLPSFSLLLDLSGNIKKVVRNTRTICPAGTIYNLGDDSCSTERCGGENVIIDEICYRLDVTMSVLKEAELKAVIVAVRDTPTSDNITPTMRAELSVEVPGLTVENITVDHYCTLMLTLDENWQDLLGPLPKLLSCLIIEAEYPTEEEVATLQQTVNTVSNLSASSCVIVLNHWPASRQPNCFEQGKLQNQNVSVSINIYEETVSLALGTNDTMVTVPFQEIPAVWIWPDKAAAVSCLPEIFFCSRILVDGDSYQTVGDSIIVDGFEGVLVGPSMYANVMNHSSVVVCSDALPNVTVTVEDSGVVEGVLSVVGISLSLCGLAFTLLTYSLFPVLRNIPGVCIMNLSVALFVAQLLFEVAPFSSGHEVLCNRSGSSGTLQLAGSFPLDERPGL